MADKQFYKNLRPFKGTLIELLGDDTYFVDVPKSWHVVVVDILNSTSAVNAGNHHQVNLTATGAIISVLNAIRKVKRSNEIPYFFGGDGATFIVPSSFLNKIIHVLENYRIHIKRKIELVLRVGEIPVSNLIESDFK